MRFPTLLLLLFSLSLAAQDTCRFQSLRIKSDYSGYLFYTKDKINDIKMIIAPGDQHCAAIFANSLKARPFVKKVSFGKSQSDSIEFVVKLKYQPAADEFRKAIESFAPAFIYINDSRYWLISVVSLDEARKKQSEMDISPLQWNSACGDPNMPEYYTYRIWSLKTKLHYMLGGDYARYLYTGYITQFLDDIDNARKDKEDYEKLH
jgi:hypothetical protein